MILDEIVASKKRELAATKSQIPIKKIRELALTSQKPKDFATSIQGTRLKLIAEVKKASPSKGQLALNFDPVKIAQIYAKNGAAAISVLTESKFFMGSLEYLNNILIALGDIRPPLLRKDFLFDTYQIYESRAHGADAVLLISAILSPSLLKELLSLVHELGMAALVEIHNERELETALTSDARIIGINNRDLATFKVDITTTERLRKLVPEGKTVVSESGIKNRTDIDLMQQWGVDAVLIGEAFMAAPDIAAKMRELQ